MTWGIIFMSLYFWSDNRAVFQISALVIHCLTTIRTCKTFPKNGAPGTCFVNRPYWIQLNESSPLRWGHVEAPWWCGSILKLKNKTNTHKALWGNFCSGLVCKELTNKVLVWLGLFTQAGHIQPRVMLHQDHRRRSQERLSGTSVPKTGMRSKPLLTCMSNPASKKTLQWLQFKSLCRETWHPELLPNVSPNIPCYSTSSWLLLSPQAGLFHSYSQQPFAYLEDLTTFHLGLLSFKQTIPSAFFCKSSRALPPSFLLFPPDSAWLICIFSEVSCPKLGPVGLSEVLPAKYIIYLIYII